MLEQIINGIITSNLETYTYPINNSSSDEEIAVNYKKILTDYYHLSLSDNLSEAEADYFTYILELSESQPLLTLLINKIDNITFENLNLTVSNSNYFNVPDIDLYEFVSLSTPDYESILIRYFNLSMSAELSDADADFMDDVLDITQSDQLFNFIIDEFDKYTFYKLNFFNEDTINYIESQEAIARQTLSSKINAHEELSVDILTRLNLRYLQSKTDESIEKELKNKSEKDKEYNIILNKIKFTTKSKLFKYWSEEAFIGSEDIIFAITTSFILIAMLGDVYSSSDEIKPDFSETHDVNILHRYLPLLDDVINLWGNHLDLVIANDASDVGHENQPMENRLSDWEPGNFSMNHNSGGKNRTSEDSSTDIDFPRVDLDLEFREINILDSPDNSNQTEDNKKDELEEKIEIIEVEIASLNVDYSDFKTNANSLQNLVRPSSSGTPNFPSNNSDINSFLGPIQVNHLDTPTVKVETSAREEESVRQQPITVSNLNFTILENSSNDSNVGQIMTSEIDINEAPSLDTQTFTIAENSANGVIIGTLVAFDPDNDPLNFLIATTVDLDGDGNDAFRLEGNQIIVNDSDDLDFETENTFALAIDTSDGNLVDGAIATIMITDINEAPTIENQRFTTVENSVNDTVVDTLVATDPDDNTLSFSIENTVDPDGDGNAAFRIEDNQILINDRDDLNFEVNDTFSLSVAANDTELSDTAIITINLTDDPSEPTTLWSFDDVSSGIVVDSVGQSDGLLQNNPTPVAGAVNNALRFDGIDDYIEVVDNDALDMGTGDFSISFWIRTTNMMGTEVILDKRIEQSGPVQGYSLYTYQGKVGIQLANGIDIGFTNFTNPTIIADGQWHQITVTVERNNPTGGKWYVDGTPTGQFNPTGRQGSLNNNQELTIGRRSDSTNPGYFTGSIDELALYNFDLTDVVDDFDPGIDASQWSTINGGVARNDFGQSGNALFFSGDGPREAITQDITGGATSVSFDIIFGDGINGGEDVDVGKDVSLEYSVNGGNTWTVLQTYNTEAFTSWTTITEFLPTLASSATLNLRWQQAIHDGSSFDNWAIDNVQIF